MNRSIDVENSRMGNKILQMKPSIGTIHDWQHHYGDVCSRRKLASKVKDTKMMSLYSRDRFVPDHYKTFLERDGSTMILKDRLFELPKIIGGGDNEDHYPNHRKSDMDTIDLDLRKIIKDTSG